MKSLWTQGVKLPNFPKLEGDKVCDVLIIGGGIAGILTAYFLHEKGVNYILVEKDRICGGVTQNTTAKITAQHGLIYNKMLKSTGKEKTKRYIDINEKAVKKYKELCSSADCDFEIKNNFVYSLEDFKKIHDEVSALKNIGHDCIYKKETELPFKIAGAVGFKDQAQFHPLKFAAHISKNLNIFENTFVKEMIDTTAVTDIAKIKAKRVIVTTHFPFINKHGSYFLKLYQHRSYVIGLKGAKELNGMYVDEAKKGLSFRSYKDILILGGGSHRTGKKGGDWNELRQFAKKNYPDLKEEYFWATQDCMSLDELPYIGNYSANTPDLYTATGFNKWGMTGAMVAAMLLSDIVTDTENEYADLFNPSRSILKKQLLINGFEAVSSLITVSEKRCPHLGCALKWNAAEHSWDCPCHGSRFSDKGRVIDNPANGDLY